MLAVYISGNYIDLVVGEYKRHCDIGFTFCLDAITVIYASIFILHYRTLLF